MKVLEGKKAVLEFMSPNTGDYLPFICADDCSIHFTGTKLPTQTRGSGPWETYVMDSKGFSVACGGLIPYTDETLAGVTIWDLYSYYDQMTEAPFRLIFFDPQDNVIKAILGNVFVMDINITGNASDFAGGTLSFDGTGPAVLQDNLLACQAVLDDVTLSLQSEIAVHFSYSGFTGGNRIDYTIDGGSRRSVFPSSDSGVINLNPVQMPEAFVNGDHTAVFYPMCESGEDGAPFTLDYTKT